MDGIMPVVAHRERQLHLVPAELVRIDCGLHRHHVIERRETKTAARTQENAEVLGVTVGRAEQPENDLRFEEEAPVRFRIVAALEDVQDRSHAWSAIGFVFARRRHGQRLTAVFLRQAQQPPVLGPKPVEPLDDEDAVSFEVGHCDIGAGQAKAGSEFQAKIFVLNAAREIDAAGQYADLRLYNVGGGRSAVRHVPFFLPEQQGGFLLRPRERNSKFLILIDAKRCGAEIAYLAGDVVRADGPPFYSAGRSWLNALG